MYTVVGTKNRLPLGDDRWMQLDTKLSESLTAIQIEIPKDQCPIPYGYDLHHHFIYLILRFVFIYFLWNWFLADTDLIKPIGR